MELVGMTDTKALVDLREVTDKFKARQAVP